MVKYNGNIDSEEDKYIEFENVDLPYNKLSVELLALPPN